MMGGGGGGGDTMCSSHSNRYPAKKTWSILVPGIISALCGLIIGYEIGITGGIMLMPKFLKDNFPESIIVPTSQFCAYNSDILKEYTSTLYGIAWLASSLVSRFTKGFRSKFSIMSGGICFLVGAVVTVIFPGRIDGRSVLGVGFGVTIQNVPLYISQNTHYKYRSALNFSFQMMITIGIFVANLVNYGTNNINSGWGWRVVLALAAVPATIISIIPLLLPDNPNLLIEDGEFEKAKDVLRRIHDTNDVDTEFDNILTDQETLKKVNTPWRNIGKRKHRYHLVMAICIPLVQHLTGISAIMFYAPLLFNAIGFGTNASLLFTVIIGGVNVAATFVAIILANRFRRVLLIAGGILMFVCQIMIGVLWDKLGGANNLVVVTLICICVSSFALSWGPLGWHVPGEVSPLEIQSAGDTITSSVNMLFAYFMAQDFLKMLCHFKFGIFYIFAFFALAMTIFAIFFLPEMDGNGMPVEEMSQAWKQHWLWRRYIISDSDHDVNRSQIDSVKKPLLTSVIIA